MKTIIILISVLLLASCGNDQDTVRTLRSAGYTQVRSTGWEPFSCGKDDTWSTGFTATNPAGQRVRGVVCCGLLFKGCTIRF